MNEYQRYQLKWMLDHDHSLDELIEEIEKMRIEEPDTTIRSLFDDWEYGHGFGGELWVCEHEWEGSEAKTSESPALHVETPLGAITARLSGYGDEYPGIWVELIREKGGDVGLALVEYTETEGDLTGGHVITRVYGDAMNDEYTDRVVHKQIDKWYEEVESDGN